jgi:hypothetical protein
VGRRAAGRPPAGAGRGTAVAACGLLALSWLATLTLHPWSDESVGDLGSRSTVAELVLGGALPYRDFPFEYPPLAAPVIALPGLAGSYHAGIAAATFAVAVAVLLLCRTLALRTGGDPRLAMLGIAVAPLLLGAVIRLHIDLVPVALVLAALVALLARRTAVAFALIGVGTMVKAFPLVAAPVALAWLVARGERATAVRGVAALAATLVILGAAWVALSPQGALDSVRFQLERPVQIESSPASVLFGVGALGGPDPEVVASHRSAGVVHPAAGVVARAFAVALVLAVLMLAALAARARSERALVLATLATVAAFAALGRVLSPQFLVWVVPLLALALAWRRWALVTLAALACALTLAEFPGRYAVLTAAESPVVALVAARNAALVAVVCLAAGGLARHPRSGSPTGAAATA